MTEETPTRVVQSFIAGGTIDADICDGVLDFYETCDYLEKTPGETSQGVNKVIKQSMDMAVPSWIKDPRIVKYLDAVQGGISLYIEQYPWASMADLEVLEPFNIQHYIPGACFSQPHTERVGSNKTSAFRHLVWMTYLNDIEEGGGTNFVHQDLELEPKKGLTMIWPADWTHVHHGIPAPKEDKYIVTGWISYA